MKGIILLLFIGLFLSSCKKAQLKSLPSDIPDCIQEKIEIFKGQPKGNPPRSIIEYLYKDKRVFYIPPQCCDQYSDLLDEDCKLLGHPDGGLAGKGDGTHPGFFTDAKNAKLIWKDDR